MVNGVNCGFVFPPPDLIDHTCSCGDGYVNDEGTLIPGSIIKKGHALRKSDYHSHKGCKLCAVDPLKCGWRQRHLNPQNPRTIITAPPDGIFEFFVPDEGISESVLQMFLHRNNSGDDTSLLERRFKGESGFFVRSSFRFNAQDLKQLKELRSLQRQGGNWHSELRRTSPPSNQPFNEFTSYTKSNVTTLSGATKLPTTSHSASVPEQREKSQSQYSRRSADDDDQVGSRRVRTSSSFDDDLPQVTSQAGRMTVSSRHKQPSPEPTPYSRHSKDIQHPKNKGDDRDETLPVALPERHPQASWTQRESESRLRSSLPQQNDSYNEEDAFSRSTAPEERRKPARAVDDRDGSLQPRSSRPDPARQSSTYHGHYGNQITADAQTQSGHVAAVTMQDENESFGRQQAWSSDDEDDRTDSSSRQQESYSTSPITQARNPVVKVPNLTQPRHRAQDTPELTKIPNQPVSHVVRATNPEPGSGILKSKHQEATSEDEAHSVQKVKWFVGATNVDQEVLALYLMYCVDHKARIQGTTNKGRSGFLVEAARTLTSDELEDIRSDTSSWRREREAGRGRVPYRDSETAKRRKRASGGR